MRIFVAGASGVIGVRLVPVLVARGHTVAGMTRTAGKIDLLRELGAQPVLCDVFDAPRLVEEMRAFSPELVMHQLTDLPNDLAGLPGKAAANNRIRREGTRNLIEAARAAGARRLLAQSVAFPLEGDAAAAVAEHEKAVLDAGGVVLRYGQLFGPGTWHVHERPPPPAVNIDDAVLRTVAALDAASRVMTLVDRE